MNTVYPSVLTSDNELEALQKCLRLIFSTPFILFLKENMIRSVQITMKHAKLWILFSERNSEK